MVISKLKSKKGLSALSTFFLILFLLSHIFTKYIFEFSTKTEQVFTTILNYQFFISLFIAIFNIVSSEKKAIERQVSLASLPLLILTGIYLAFYALIYAAAGGGAIVS